MPGQSLSLYVAFFGILLGTLLRTYLPGLAAQAEAQAKAQAKGERFQWDWRYVFSAVSSGGFALVVVSLSLASYQINYGVDPLFLFLGSFSYGFVQNQVFNQVLEWWREASKGEASSPAASSTEASK